MLERSTHKANFFNYSGCGNTVNANNGATKRMILDSLRHWRAKTDPLYLSSLIAAAGTTGTAYASEAVCSRVPRVRDCLRD